MQGHTIPPWHSRRFQSPTVIPDVFNPPAVIPDVFNRESTAFPMQGHTNEGTEEKDTGFPLTTGGNDITHLLFNGVNAKRPHLLKKTFVLLFPTLFGIYAAKNGSLTVSSVFACYSAVDVGVHRTT